MNAHAPIRSYRDLIVWRKAIALAVETYRLTHDFPATERYALTSQIRRAASAIRANIAEGHGSSYRARFDAHLGVARGSLSELESHMMLATALRYPRASTEKFELLADEVGRMLTVLQRAISKRHR